MANKLQRAFLGEVRKQGFFLPGETVLVATSGGKDSMALLELMASLAKTLDISIIVAHLNHGIRGQEASRDAESVAEAARRLKLPFHCARARVSVRAKNRGISIEMAAREARYAFFRKICRQTYATCIATAHTADDQAETLLLKLARGAGSGGLAGIPPISTHHGLRLVRPLLAFTGKELCDYLRACNLTWREDASNTDPAFLRNRVRTEILPLLEERLNPCVRDALTRTADILRQEDEWMQSMAELLLKECSATESNTGDLHITQLASLPPAALRRVLIRWLSTSGVDNTDIDYRRLDSITRLVLSHRGSGHVQLPGNLLVYRQGGWLSLVPSESNARASLPVCPLPQRKHTHRFPEWGLKVTIEPRTGILKPTCPGPGILPACASISKKAVAGHQLSIRAWRPGDRMRPLGMKGSRKLQDIFVDAKVPPSKRNRIPLLVCGGEIIWVPGYRVAQGWEVNAPSDPALHVLFTPLKPQS
ncbi:MAG: tRNA lysidine(34) synthetase TilS [Kiritimatiellae bacterium]|nr:tRNA lysidine(34) synthetase TilS [Kiritimatiellia bacterium]